LRLLPRRDEHRRQRDCRVRRLRHRRPRRLLRNRARSGPLGDRQRGQHGLVCQHRAVVLRAVQGRAAEPTQVRGIIVILPINYRTQFKSFNSGK
jgi:hypothetical protein